MALSKEARNIYIDTRAWLAREHIFRASQYKAGAGRPAYASVRTNSILDNSLPRTWNEYRELRKLHELKSYKPSEKLKLKLGQTALLSSAWAQSAYIWNLLGQRHDMRSAGKESFEEMDLYIDSVSHSYRWLPAPELLDMPLEQVLAEENSNINARSRSASILKTVLGLTITAIEDQTATGKEPLLPMPGQRMGIVYPWMPPRLHECEGSIDHT